MQSPRTRPAYRPRARPTVKVQCWCGCQQVEVDADVVKAGATHSCGRNLCNALEWNQVLTAGGQPCDCRQRR